MPSGHYEGARRASGERHPQFKHGKYVGEHRTPEARRKGRERSQRWSAQNRERRLEQQRKYREAHREQIRARARDYMRRPTVIARVAQNRQAAEGKARKREEWKRFRASARYAPKILRGRCKSYGITVAEFEAMHAKQGGACAVCRTVPTKLLIDHDHRSGAVRGLLCRGCNTMVGYLEANAKRLTAAHAYIKLHGEAAICPQ